MTEYSDKNHNNISMGSITTTTAAANITANTANAAGVGDYGHREDEEQVHKKGKTHCSLL
jgi:hypothetical protein